MDYVRRGPDPVSVAVLLEDGAAVAGVVGADGRCMFKHGICDQFVTDKGKGGQCGSTQHKRPNCDYDSSKKCTRPVA